MNQLNLKKSIQGSDGYSTKLNLTEEEIVSLRNMIRMQWLYRLQLIVPNEIQTINEVGIERYHEFSNLFDHASTWPKTSRVLPKEAAKIIKNMPFFKKLSEEFTIKHVSDEENFGWDNFSWRLARPGNEDYGSIHADKWFADLGYYGKQVDPSWEPIKIWIPIYTVPGKNGLRIIPGSHLKNDWKWHMESRHGRSKPIFDEDESKLNIILLETSPGQAVVFHNDLLHGGAPNLAATTRVSLEFTIYA